MYKITKLQHFELNFVYGRQSLMTSIIISVPITDHEIVSWDWLQSGCYENQARAAGCININYNWNDIHYHTTPVQYSTLGITEKHFVPLGGQHIFSHFRLEAGLGKLGKLTGKFDDSFGMCVKRNVRFKKFRFVVQLCNNRGQCWLNNAFFIWPFMMHNWTAFILLRVTWGTPNKDPFAPKLRLS